MNDKENVTNVANTNTSIATKDETTTSVNDGASNIASLNLFSSDGLTAAENFLNRFIKSKTGGITTVNDGLAILARANDLQLPFTSCVDHIHVVNGKTGLDVHLIKTLLSRAGLWWNWTSDYEPLYEYTDGINVYVQNEIPSYAVICSSQAEAIAKRKEDINNNSASNNNDEDFNNESDFIVSPTGLFLYPVTYYSDFNKNVFPQYQLSSKKHIVVASVKEANEAAANGLIGIFKTTNRPIDFKAEVVIHRRINDKVISQKGSFTYKEAYAAGFFDKDTYKKYPKVLIKHRAFTYAAREIASDLLMGCMETTELKIVEGVELTPKDISDIEEATVIN